MSGLLVGSVVTALSAEGSGRYDSLLEGSTLASLVWWLSNCYNTGYIQNHFSLLVN